MVKDIENAAYAELLEQLKLKTGAQYEALKAVNRELISLYWDVGQARRERKQREGWGKSVVEQVAHDLQSYYPGVRGFSSASLWRMRLFYEVYGANLKLAPLVREIGWSHNIIIMEKCNDDLEREFYIKMARKHGWTKNVLIHQIENQSYEKTLLNQTNFDNTLPEILLQQAKLATKTNILLISLELGEEHRNSS